MFQPHYSFGFALGFNSDERNLVTDFLENLITPAAAGAAGLYNYPLLKQLALNETHLRELGFFKINDIAFF
jgi:hypothetical protein